MFSKTTSDSSVLEELGRRLARCRLNRDLTQEALAREAGISSPTVQRLERGHSTQTSNLIRILRALDLLENLEALVPPPVPSPLQQAKMQGKQRQRASSRRRPDDPPTWTWNDEQ